LVIPPTITIKTQQQRLTHPPTYTQIHHQVKIPDWEAYIGKLAALLIQEQTPQVLVLAREHLYELLTNCIPPDVILKVCVLWVVWRTLWLGGGLDRSLHHHQTTTPRPAGPSTNTYISTHQVLVRELSPKLDDSLKHELAHWAAFYEHRVQIGSKEIFHLEVRLVLRPLWPFTLPYSLSRLTYFPSKYTRLFRRSARASWPYTRSG
jgi:hypothetical protein